MEDLEAYIKSKDKTYKKFDMSEFADVEDKLGKAAYLQIETE